MSSQSDHKMMRIQDRGIMGLRSTQGDEKRFLFSNDSPLEAPPSRLSSRQEIRGSAAVDNVATRGYIVV